MSKLTTEDRVIHVIEDHVMIGQTLTRETTWDDIGFDSLDKIALLMDIEDEFNIDIPDEIITMLDNIGEIVDYIDKRVK